MKFIICGIEYREVRLYRTTEYAQRDLTQMHKNGNLRQQAHFSDRFSRSMRTIFRHFENAIQDYILVENIYGFI